MVRAFQYGNYSVFVFDERGAPHHRPHAHIKLRGRRIASVFLETLEVFIANDELPEGLRDQLRTEQDRMIELWGELNNVE